MKTHWSIASASNLICIQVKDIVKEVEDYLKAYPSDEIDISCKKVWWQIPSPNPTWHFPLACHDTTALAIFSPIGCSSSTQRDTSIKQNDETKEPFELKYLQARVGEKSEKLATLFKSK
ncbi:hypothetical protein Tco_1537531, partial [Tanacetum coccineum]